MKKIVFCLLVSLSVFALAGAPFAKMTFYLIDNFEDNSFSNKWYVFDNVEGTLVDNPGLDIEDSVSEACGEKSLKLIGKTNNWYVGGMGTLLEVDGMDYSRIVIDVYGSSNFGKIKLELFEKEKDKVDQKGNLSETKWVVEIPVLGEGFTRYSVPFSSFYSEDTKDSGKVVFHGRQGGNISKLQAIFVASSKEGEFDCMVDNLMFTF
ncbi:hypothetical protein A2230_03820 [candidate division WOR-1 bacterium RIFOXYA2_FULL_36_21]|uniref:NADH:ubiquinone oxidoreductase intermediate-associated protein 30 domain-containing protein n=1 Tax=candidate division WOR-1 bacterium RIFOXYB2_FULL_36_35 TaxID=1802578 RepID=A0A1F4S1Z6_UNCSA|nr:MAG: hypothetical protein A2230_03820 [candidate division WOR-1 bacterium RIFOXYA2_FULL_36_21]OGC14452.1 MAG: hypothetical protein A2290_08515 [candidate division WOR-1 bacterium RIFOXYB2_FULL_36_35]OGC18536.1 MAG: hypothetical protein A2282_03155 [candidate division WOR-1 bacterium RIFOXYA12_FULL_36_13]